MSPFSSSLSLDDDDNEEEVYEPLLSRRNLNTNNNNQCAKFCIKLSSLLYCFCVAFFFLIAITSFIDLFLPSEPTLINDISIIPNQYHLKGLGGFCSRCDYNIEENKKLYIEENKQNNNVSSSFIKKSAPSSIILARLISTSKWYNVFSRKYSIREFRFNHALNTTNEVSTAFTIHNWWYGTVEVRFPAAMISKDDVGDDDNDDDDSTISKQSCVYKICFSTFSFEGSIFKKCENNGDLEFFKISSVTGNVKKGLEFLSADNSTAFAKTIRTNSMFSSTPERNVTINQNAPFPNILPAIYSVYHDLAVRRD